MAEGKLGAVESRFADIVWAHAPLASRELARLCEQELGWKRTTTYNVLRKLCERGLFRTTAVRSARSSRARRFTARRERRWSIRRSAGRCLHFWQRLRGGARSAAAKSRKYRR